jgi:hypothetical protein
MKKTAIPALALAILLASCQTPAKYEPSSVETENSTALILEGLKKQPVTDLKSLLGYTIDQEALTLRLSVAIDSYYHQEQRRLVIKRADIIDCTVVQSLFGLAGWSVQVNTKKGSNIVSFEFGSQAAANSFADAFLAWAKSGAAE